MSKMRAYALAGAVFLAGVGLQAQETKKEKKEDRLALDNVVVVATKNQRTVAKTPYTVHQWDADEVVLEKQARSITEALRGTPGIMLQKTGHGMTSPYLRGVTSQRTALYADGVRVNNSFLREGPNQYWNLVDHYYYTNLQVLMGPASVLYGSDAIGGVILTRSTDLARGAAAGGSQWLGGDFVTRAASAESSLSAHLRGSVAAGDKWTFGFGLTAQDFGELKSGDGEENPHTNYEQWSGNLRAKRWLSDNAWLLFGYDHFNQNDVDRVHRTLYHVDYYGTLSKGKTSDVHRIYDHERRVAFGQYGWRNGGGLVQEVDFGVSYQSLVEDYRRIRDDGREQLFFTRVMTTGVNGRVQMNTNAGVLTWGIDFYRDNVNASGQNRAADGTLEQRDQGLVGDDAIYDLAGTYLQLETELTQRLDMITGLRYTYADMDAGKVDFDGDIRSLSGNWDALTGSLRFMLEVLDDNRLNLFTGLSQGFRAPNLSDTTRSDDFGGGEELPTADLDAEHFTTFELGGKSVGGWGYVTATAFWTDIEDRIARLKNNRVDEDATKRNLHDGYIYGVELLAEVDLAGGFSAYNGVAWSRGSERTYYDRFVTEPGADRPISRVPPLHGTFALKWRSPDRSFWAEASLDWSRKQKRLTDAEESDNRFPPDGSPAWQCYNLRGGWHATDNLSLSLAVENITDAQYRVHGSGVNEPGRNVVATVACRF